jgi:pyruvate dehydrogenase E1 component alpha subunit
LTHRRTRRSQPGLEVAGASSEINFSVNELAAGSNPPLTPHRLPHWGEFGYVRKTLPGCLCDNGVSRIMMAVAQTKTAQSAQALSAEGLLPSADLAANEMISAPAFNKEQELVALRQMLLIRRFEEKAGQMYGMGLIGGFCHLYIGQEAVVVGMKLAMRDGDQMITGYRDHGHMLACGMDPKGVMAELTGRRGGYSKGKGGSMHMFSLEKNFYGGHGIVGAQVPLGTGLAFANKYRGSDDVCVTYFGDGAANQGQVYESFNMAELWKLPVVYVIENNRYAMGTSVTRSSAQADFSKRGVSFNIPGSQVDGMDVRAVKAAGEDALAWCRSGKGPIILEMMTYRYRGHSMSDPAKYRTKEEVDKVRTEHDPIEQVRQRLLDKKWASEDELKKIDAAVRAIVNEASEFATHDPEPDPSELYTDVYR